MNWLRKIFGYRDSEFDGDDFSVRIKPIMREAVSVVYTRHPASFNLSGERIGRKWEGVQVWIPQEVEAARVPQIVRDLEIAFAMMRYGYVIVRRAGADIVPETERQAAIAELNEMGYDIEILPDRSIRHTRRAGVPRPDFEAAQKQASRIMALLQSVHGTRQHFEILAKSKEF